MMNKEKLVPIAVFLLRIVAGYLFILAGGGKLFGWFGGDGFASLPALIKTAGILEFFGGIAIVLGLFTRQVAFVLSGLMAFAYFLGHVANKGEFLLPNLNGGQFPVLLCFVFLFLAAYGAGTWGLDSWMKNRKSDNASGGGMGSN